jgi:hypothetical protein
VFLKFFPKILKYFPEFGIFSGPPALVLEKALAKALKF